MASSREEGSKGEDFFGALLSQFRDDSRGGPVLEVVSVQDDPELMAFLDDVEKNDGVREAAKVKTMLEAMPNLPEGPDDDAVLAGDVTPESLPVVSVRSPSPTEEVVSPGVLPDKVLTTTNLTLKALFGMEPEEEESSTSDMQLAPLPTAGDPLQPRRLFANRRIRHFFTESVKTSVAFSIVRLMMSTGLDRLTLFELEGELVHSDEALRVSLKALERSGLIVCQQKRYSLNPRSRNALLMGQLVSLWQDVEGRRQIWAWMEPSSQS